MQSGDDQAATNGCILVAEDDTIVQMVVKKILEQAAYKTDFVVDGKEAIDALESRHYDLVVMDCLMPRMDGFEATHFIRSGASGRINPAIPVIAMTGLTAEDDKTRCRDAGMNTYVGKPVVPQMLISTIEQCLGRAEDEQSVAQQFEQEPEKIWDDEFMDTIIENFLAEVPQVITGLQRSIKQGDVVNLQNIGHRLRGATDILGASTLSVVAQALEQAGKAGDLMGANRLASELIEELKKLTTVLSQ
jgi:two-component system sensor histidine kinase/response regulator